VLQSLSTDKFPYFCAYLVQLHQVFKVLLLGIAARSPLLQSADRTRIVRLSTFLAAAAASWISLPLLNSPRPTPSPPQANGNGTTRPSANGNANGTARKPRGSSPGAGYAGRTLDLTVLASVRAFETLVHRTWRSQSGHLPATLAGAISSAADPALFIASTAVIMWNWFYHPARLPPSYNRWISSAAAVDPGLIECLRAARAGTFLYGHRTGPANNILLPMCAEHGWPAEWGDPEFVRGIPCEVVHSGAGPSCHVHAAWRFMRAFRFSMAMYLPLQLVLKLRNPAALRRAPAARLGSAVREAARSSAFLGGFIGAFYYAVCAARTLIGPKLFSEEQVSRQDWDSGLCVAAGCGACGWSVLIEKAQRRQELALFVAPRALATVLPRKYERGHFWRERAAFAASVGVLFAASADGSRGVRGVVGTLLDGVLN
jgi:hypothetical protein